MLNQSWLSPYRKLSLAGALAILGAIGGVSDRSIAQIAPDATLGAESSRVTSAGPGASQIDGGATRGTNLFHSFSQFSVPTNGVASFNNAQSIQNIISRVTGGSVSNIDGLLKANGNANLFLINPSGIIFGPNASLNIGGSFLASTANSINFADGTYFSATAPQTKPLLSINVPLGLQFGSNPGSIVVQGTGYDLSATAPPPFSPIIRGSRSTGLSVPAGKTLALLGGDVDIQGGTLTAEQGRIELGSVRNGQVSLSSTPSGFALGYQSIGSFGDIQLSGQSLADTSGSPGGSIQVQGNQVSLTDGSIILNQNQGEQDAGSISINAAQPLELSESSLNGQLYGGLKSEALKGGRGADIAVSTPQLVVRDGAGIVTGSYGSGRAGDVKVSASDSVQIIGASSVNPSLNSGISSGAFYNSGDTGNVTVVTGRLIVLNGGALGTQTFGTGKGGDVTVNAAASAEVIGVSHTKLSNVFAITDSAGDAGKLTINTSRLVLGNGGVVSAATVETGDAGSVFIDAKESVEISGGAQFSIFVPSQISASGFFDPSGPPPRGDSGGVTITTGRLSVTDGALVSVRHEGTGDAGTLRVNANSIFLDRGGAITAATASGTGGNISLQVGDLLLLRHNSQITTSASGTGNGGNININTPLLVALPNEDSDISANSINFRGGNVTINTQGIFGTQFRDQNTLLNDITATGRDSALNGTVQINVEDVNPRAGLVELPTSVVDPTRLIAQGCPAQQGSSFVVSGRGGLPPTPQQALGDDPGWRDWRSTAVVSGQHSQSRNSTSPLRQEARNTPVASQSIVEATGWVIGSDGEVILTANAPNVTPHSPWSKPANCYGS